MKLGHHIRGHTRAGGRLGLRRQEHPSCNVGSAAKSNTHDKDLQTPCKTAPTQTVRWVGETSLLLGAQANRAEGLHKALHQVGCAAITSRKL